MAVPGINGATPIKILIAGMGGEGGGTLANWVVHAARSKDFPVQATSVPGVAQRTGATTYYIEMLATGKSKLNGRRPVLDLYPRPGDVDLVIATELLEAGRTIERGYVSPGKTTLIASTHRVYSLAEKMETGDGRYAGDAVLKAAADMAARVFLIDMERAAADAGSAANAVILGAIAAAGVLPIDAAAFEQAIVQEGKAVQSNLAGFTTGRASVEQTRVRDEANHTPPRATGRGKEATEALRVRIQRDFAPALRPMVLCAADRCLDFLDSTYSELFLDRLDSIRQLAGANADLLRETARHLGLRMAYEDVFRIAQLKSRASRFARIRREVGAAPDELVRVTEFLKPGPEELAQVLPRFIGRPITRWARANPARARALHIGMRLRSDTVLGLMRLRVMAGLRGLRRFGERYAEEQQSIERWLDLVRRALGIDPALAHEVVECAGLIKGYADTHARGTGNFQRILETLVEPAINGAAFSAADLAKARNAALADPGGEMLADTLVGVTGRCGTAPARLLDIGRPR